MTTTAAPRVFSVKDLLAAIRANTGLFYTFPYFKSYPGMDNPKCGYQLLAALAILERIAGKQILFQDSERDGEWDCRNLDTKTSPLAAALALLDEADRVVVEEALRVEGKLIYEACFRHDDRPHFLGLGYEKMIKFGMDRFRRAFAGERSKPDVVSVVGQSRWTHHGMICVLPAGAITREMVAEYADFAIRQGAWICIWSDGAQRHVIRGASQIGGRVEKDGFFGDGSLQTLLGQRLGEGWEITRDQAVASGACRSIDSFYLMTLLYGLLMERYFSFFYEHRQHGTSES